MHQLASASLVAAFSIGLFLTAQFFNDYRSTHHPAITFAARTLAPL